MSRIFYSFFSRSHQFFIFVYLGVAHLCKLLTQRFYIEILSLCRKLLSGYLGCLVVSQLFLKAATCTSNKKHQRPRIIDTYYTVRTRTYPKTLCFRVLRILITQFWRYVNDFFQYILRKCLSIDFVYLALYICFFFR